MWLARTTMHLLPFQYLAIHSVCEEQILPPLSSSIPVLYPQEQVELLGSAQFDDLP